MGAASRDGGWPAVKSALEADHAFIACTPGAPEADALLQLGFVEGSRNTHPGQGTANRRFFFDNFMLELIWIADSAEARSAAARRTRLWERCLSKESGNNPIGILFRKTGAFEVPAPFRVWAYRPSYLSPGLAIEIAAETTLQEPELFYLPFVSGSASRPSEPKNHALPFRRVRGLSAGVRSLGALSDASRAVEERGLVSYFESSQDVLEIHFEGCTGTRVSFEPTLPLVFSGVQS